MKRICAAMVSLILVLTLFPGAVCAEAVSTSAFDEVSTFPYSPFDFYTKLCMINNTLSKPYQVELNTEDYLSVQVSDGNKDLLTINFDQIVYWKDAMNIRELMTPDMKFERCDYINTYPMYKGMRMDEHEIPAEVVEVQILVQMACDPQIKRIEDSDKVYKMLCDAIDEGKTKELNDIVLECDCWMSYGVMLSLRDAATQALDNSHH